MTVFQMVQPQVTKVWERGYRVHTSLVRRPFSEKGGVEVSKRRWNEHEQESRRERSNLTLALVYGCIPAVSIAEGKC